MFGNLSRGWQFAALSYRIIWNHKKLLLFPLLSTIAAILVSLSYAVPLWASGAVDHLISLANHSKSSFSADQWPIYLAVFGFYFVNYFVIIFFNSALIGCTMQVLAGEPPQLTYGLGIAAKRLPQILGWSIVAAVVGTILHTIEHAHERVGSLIAAILGTAWSAMVFFVVPVLVVDNVGPIDAIKTSVTLLRRNWGTALAGNFSIGAIGVLIALPVFLLFFILGIYASHTSEAALIAVAALAVLCIVVISIVNSMAGTVFKAVLFNWATDRNIPDDLDTGAFHQAFRPRKQRNAF